MRQQSCKEQVQLTASQLVDACVLEGQALLSSLQRCLQSHVALGVVSLACIKSNLPRHPGGV